MIDIGHLIKALWPLWVTIGVVVVVKILFNEVLPDLINNWRNRRRFRAGEKWRSDRELLRWLKAMKPSEFENYIAGLFNKLGYKTEVTGGSHDKGVDVIAEKDGVKHYIQCKKFITSTVGVGSMRDFYGAIADHLAKGKAFFITTNKFTLEAEKYADDKPIELIDGHRLVEYIHLAEKQKVETLEIKTVEAEKCPECSGDLIQREGKFGKFLGCSNYPKCKFTKNQQSKFMDEETKEPMKDYNLEEGNAVELKDDL